MSRLIVTPNSQRAKMEYVQLQDRFEDALLATGSCLKLDLSLLGVDWNSAILENQNHKQFSFYLADEHTGREGINGLIYDRGNKQPVVEITRNTREVGSSGMTAGYIIRSLSEAVDIASKLEIMDGVEFLPPGDDPDLIHSGSHADGSGPNINYKIFAAELLKKGGAIITGRVNEAFGEYIVVKSWKDWYIAYNKSYGEAPYIVTDLSDLLLDKQTLRKSGKAIHFRRDHRGEEQWMQRIREFL